MMCPRCLHRLTTTPSRTLRPLSTSARLLHPASAPDLSTQNSPRGPPTGTHEGPPAALSTSAAQPFSSPLPPAPSSLPDSGNPSLAEAAPRSSVAAGTMLKGLGYVKGQDAPIAKEDSEYPAWLWGLLSEKRGKVEAKEGEEGEEGDFYSKSKKQRRLANKRAALLASSAALDPARRKVPLEHQSIDLPAGDGTVAGAIRAAEAREEVRGALRRGRRKGIKEGNYLKTMR